MSSIYNRDLVSLVGQLVSITPKLIETIQQENNIMNAYEIYNGINTNLPITLLQSFKEQIITLTKLVALQEEKIRLLEAKN